MLLHSKFLYYMHKTAKHSKKNNIQLSPIMYTFNGYFYVQGITG